MSYDYQEENLKKREKARKKSGNKAASFSLSLWKSEQEITWGFPYLTNALVIAEGVQNDEVEDKKGMS